MILNALRGQRDRVFAYFPVDHPYASQIMTNEERYLLLTLRAVRRRDKAAAPANAMLIYEGADHADLLAAVERLAIITGDVETPLFARTETA